MGFDSFGLPAENAAKLNNQNPFKWTESNIQQMKSQLNNALYHFHWRESTSDPSYYRWTQWLFLKLYESGLAYQGMSLVNWDPDDCTVLADEQVDAEGRSWRSGAVVEKRFHKQWQIKTNAFSEELYKGDDIIDTGHWSFILAHQRWWIKKPNGYLFYLKFTDQQSVLQVFTRYPEMFLAQKAFIGLSPKHWLANGKQPNDLVSVVPNPFMENQTLDIRVVDQTDSIPVSTNATVLAYREAFEDSDKRQQVLSMAKSLGVGGYFTSDTYRDWLISRQRFWGTPIPIIHCPECGTVPVKESDLPVQLPNIDYSQISNFVSNDISSPLKNFAPKEWQVYFFCTVSKFIVSRLHVKCPKCNSDSIRETDTCDTFFDSAWYFLRYFTQPDSNRPFDSKTMPVYCYVGGKEHAALHLFYARFITHFLNSKGLLKFKEPFRTLLMQAIVKARTFKLNGKYITAAEAEGNPSAEVTYEKMSKSKGTGVNPDTLVDQYGSDALRWTIVSVGNPESERLWDNNEKEFGPTLVFFHRIMLTIEEYKSAKLGSRKIKTLGEEKYKAAIEKLEDQIDYLVFNVLYSLCSSYQVRNGTSSIHKLINALRSNIQNDVILSNQFERGLASLLIMLTPFIPCFAAECWQEFTSIQQDDHLAKQCGFDYTKSVYEQSWPKVMNENFEYIVRFTFRNEAGKEEECLRIKVPSTKLGSWSESEIRDLFDFQQTIEWIEIVKNCSVVVRVSDPALVRKKLEKQALH